MKRKRRRLRRWLLGLAVVLVLAAVICHLPIPAELTVSRETTYVTGPLNADGTVNYVAALNQMMSEGVTPDNNAAVPLLRAFGPGAWPEAVRPELFRQLGIEPLPAEGVYFIAVSDWGEAYQAPGLDKVLEGAQACPWRAEDHPALAGWLATNDKPLALIVEASERPFFYMPMLSRAKPSRVLDAIFGTGPCYYGSKALLARGMLRFQSGSLAAAWRDIAAAHRLARLARHLPMIITHLTANRLESNACAAGVMLAADARLSSDQARASLADMLAFPDTPGPMYAVNYGERFFMLDGVMILYRGDLLTGADKRLWRGGRGDYDWNEMCRRANGLCDGLAGVLGASRFVEMRERLHSLQADHVSFRERGGGSNPSFKLWLLVTLHPSATDCTGRGGRRPVAL